MMWINLLGQSSGQCLRRWLIAYVESTKENQTIRAFGREKGGIVKPLLHVSDENQRGFFRNRIISRVEPKKLGFQVCVWLWRRLVGDVMLVRSSLRKYQYPTLLCWRDCEALV